MSDEQFNRESILGLIKAFTGQTNILTIPRAFIDYTRSLDAALLLSQILYWSDRADPDGWFYKSYADWEYETTLGEYEVRKAINLFKTNGLVTTKIQKVNGNPTLHYKFHGDRFSDSFLQFLKERKPIFSRNEGRESEGTKGEKVKEPIKEEITTETTTKITTERRESAALRANAPACPVCKTPGEKRRTSAGDAVYCREHGLQILTAGVFPAPAKKFTPDPLCQNPAVIEFKRVHGSWPLPGLPREKIAMTINDIAKWRSAMESWKMRGNKPTNVEGQLDWYTTGVPANGHRPTTPQPRKAVIPG